MPDSHQSLRRSGGQQSLPDGLRFIRIRARPIVAGNCQDGKHGLRYNRRFAFALRLQPVFYFADCPCFYEVRV